MSFIQRELDRIGKAIRHSNPVPRYDELYTAQQALLWVLDPVANVKNDPQYYYEGNENISNG
jgi:hypothetical protein